MLALTLLESEALVPTFFVGLGAFVLFMIALGWVVGMGSGRPHNK